jgi:hypothetical protein
MERLMPTLHPHTAGTPWIASLHGVRIPSATECAARYDHNGVMFATMCERHGVPTGVVICEEAADLAATAPVLVSSLSEAAQRFEIMSRAAALVATTVHAAEQVAA